MSHTTHVRIHNFFFLRGGGGVGGSIDKIVFQKEGRVERHFFGNFTR